MKVFLYFTLVIIAFLCGFFINFRKNSYWNNRYWTIGNYAVVNETPLHTKMSLITNESNGSGWLKIPASIVIYNISNGHAYGYREEKSLDDRAFCYDMSGAKIVFPNCFFDIDINTNTIKYYDQSYKELFIQTYP